MTFDPTLAAVRFGCGLSPRIAPPASASAMLARLEGPDTAAARFPIEDFPTFRQRMVEVAELRQVRRKNRGTPKAAAAREAFFELSRTAKMDSLDWILAHVSRRTWTDDGFRERLAFFWRDHFTTVGKAGVMRRGASPYTESAIRPHLSGRFADLLFAAVTHPMMLIYLDQWNSVGPNSARARKRGEGTGLNENLAREVLELHTLGVGGPYTQNDVRQLAELFTGLHFDVRQGPRFRKDFAEPGAEIVLGRSYGGGEARMADVRAVLDDLAVHPATARHVSRKLATHFVSDRPEPALVETMTAAFLDTGGRLAAVYEAMLAHPAAWSAEGANVKQPFDFMTSVFRALAVPPDRLKRPGPVKVGSQILIPLALMGQQWERPAGPNGFPEQDAAWITPQGLATRLQWAMDMPARLLPELPDPRDFVVHALGPRAPERVRRAAAAAETRAVGVGLVLASPAFQRT